MCLGVSHSWVVVDWWDRVLVIMCSNHRDCVGHCTRSACPLCWSLRVCSTAPIQGAKAVESFIRANGNGFVCLLSGL